MREARAAASVRHPNVASVFHLGKSGDSYFYAMEFVDGESLPKKDLRKPIVILPFSHNRFSVTGITLLVSTQPKYRRSFSATATIKSILFSPTMYSTEHAKSELEAVSSPVKRSQNALACGQVRSIEGAPESASGVILCDVYVSRSKSSFSRTR